MAGFFSFSGVEVSSQSGQRKRAKGDKHDAGNRAEGENSPRARSPEGDPPFSENQSSWLQSALSATFQTFGSHIEKSINEARRDAAEPNPIEEEEQMT